MIYVIDDFLSFVDCDILSRVMTSAQIKWTGSSVVSIHDPLFKEYDPKYNFQLTHMFLESRTDVMVNKSTFFLLDALVNKINPLEWVRIKANLNPCNSHIIEHGFHVDYQTVRKDAWTAIYYLNTNDGYTLFKDGNKITSIKNRLVIFPANMEHTGTNCTDVYARLVINLNFYKDNIEDLIGNEL